MIDRGSGIGARRGDKLTECEFVAIRERAFIASGSLRLTSDINHFDALKGLDER